MGWKIYFDTFFSNLNTSVIFFVVCSLQKKFTYIFNSPIFLFLSRINQGKIFFNLKFILWLCLMQYKFYSFSDSLFFEKKNLKWLFFHVIFCELQNFLGKGDFKIAKYENSDFTDFLEKISFNGFILIHKRFIWTLHLGCSCSVSEH